MKIIVMIVVSVLALIAGVVVFGLLWLILSARSYSTKLRQEEEVKEEAEWFGTTGLDEKTERELPRYLRRELGKSLFDEGSLKADDLRYAGSFPEDDGLAHYWYMPHEKEENLYAYVVVSAEGGTNRGWGGREPPQMIGQQERG